MIMVKYTNRLEPSEEITLYHAFIHASLFTSLYDDVELLEVEYHHNSHTVYITDLKTLAQFAEQELLESLGRVQKYLGKTK